MLYKKITNFIKIDQIFWKKGGSKIVKFDNRSDVMHRFYSGYGRNFCNKGAKKKEFEKAIEDINSGCNSIRLNGGVEACKPRSLNEYPSEPYIISRSNALILAESIKNSKYLTSITLHDNSLRLNMVIIAQAMETSPAIRSIIVTSNFIGNDGAIAIAIAIKKLRFIANIDLSDESIEFSGIMAIAGAMRESISLKSIKLSSNKIRDEGALVLAEAMRKSTSLRFVDLSLNLIGNDGAIAISQALKVSKSIIHINLGYNSIGAQGALAIAEAIRESTSINSIILSRNSISDEGTIAISEAISESTSIKLIKLFGNSIGDNGAIAISEALKVSKSLTEIDISANSIQEIGMMKLLESSLSLSPYITLINLGVITLTSHEMYRALIKAFEISTALVQVGDVKYNGKTHPHSYFRENEISNPLYKLNCIEKYYINPKEAERFLIKIKTLLFSDIETTHFFNLALIAKTKLPLPLDLMFMVENFLGKDEIVKIAARGIRKLKLDSAANIYKDDITSDEKSSELVGIVTDTNSMKLLSQDNTQLVILADVFSEPIKSEDLPLEILRKSSLESSTLSELKESADISDIQLIKVKKKSLKESENTGIIGPREILGFDIEDVGDDGNCFYYAIANQMKIINHNSIQNVPVGTDVSNSLRLAVQGANFRDREWADDSTFDTFVTEFPDVILAIIDTRNPSAGFTCYYVNDDGVVITNTGEEYSLTIPQDKMIIRIAATGNHFLSVRAHPNLERGAITQTWNQDMGSSLVEVMSSIQSDAIINAVFEIRYNNPILNHPNIINIFKLAKERSGLVTVTKLLQLQASEALELLKIENAEEIVDRVIENNYFLSNKKGQEFIHAVASNFDAETLKIILELGRDQDTAKQILFEAEAQGMGIVMYTLLGKELPITGTTDNLENIISTEEVNKLRLIPNGILNSWSNKAYHKIADYIDNLAKDLNNMLNMGQSGDQVAITIALLEEWLGFAASGQRFVGGMPTYYDPNNDDVWSNGGGGSSSYNGSNGSVGNTNGFTGLILPLYNGSDYNITDNQM
jgi:Ran GTPase-activating protein (RanGAP) involved in mRNA processing and transport